MNGALDIVGTELFFMFHVIMLFGSMQEFGIGMRAFSPVQLYGDEAESEDPQSKFRHDRARSTR